MNILYSSDENYAKYAMVSIASLLENNCDTDEIDVYKRQSVDYWRDEDSE